MKPYTQAYENVAGNLQSTLFKISRTSNSTADTLAKEASASTIVELDHSCSKQACGLICSALQALLLVDLYNVQILVASCCV